MTGGLTEREGVGKWEVTRLRGRRAWNRRYEKGRQVVELDVIEIPRLMASEAGMLSPDDEDHVVDEVEFVVDVSVGDQVLSRVTTIKLRGAEVPEDACSAAPGAVKYWFTDCLGILEYGA